MTQQRFIDEIKIAGFKSIKELTLPLGRLNILIGANGAGKSNFIGVFSLLNAVVTSRLDTYVRTRGGANYLLHYGRKTTKEMEIAFTFGDNKHPASPRASVDLSGFEQNYKCILKPDDADALFFESEMCSELMRAFVGAGGKETELVEWARSSSEARYVLQTLWDMKVFHFHDTSVSAPMKQSSPLVLNEPVFYADAGNIAPFLYFMKTKHESSYLEIVSVIRMVAPFFADFSFGNVSDNNAMLRLEWRDTMDNQSFNANMLSDGTLRFICLATLLLQPIPPSVIILDEPELGLHPAAIALLAEMLKSASQKSQVIVSTQSVTLINHFSPEDIIVTERKPDTGESLFKRLDRKAIECWLEDYSLGAVWEKNIIGGQP